MAESHHSSAVRVSTIPSSSVSVQNGAWGWGEACLRIDYFDPVSVASICRFFPWQSRTCAIDTLKGTSRPKNDFNKNSLRGGSFWKGTASHSSRLVRPASVREYSWRFFREALGTLFAHNQPLGRQPLESRINLPVTLSPEVAHASFHGFANVVAGFVALDGKHAQHNVSSPIEGHISARYI